MRPSRGTLLLTALVLAALTACAGSQDAADDPGGDFARATERLQALEIVEDVEAMRRDDVPTDAQGQTVSPTEAVLVRVAGLPCPEQSVDCGAVLERFPSEADAQRRADFVIAFRSGTPGLGAGRIVRDGPLLLRLSDQLPRATEQALEEELTD